MLSVSRVTPAVVLGLVAAGCAGSYKIAHEDLPHFQGGIAESFQGKRVEVLTPTGTVRGTLIASPEPDAIAVRMRAADSFATEHDSIVPLGQVSQLRFPDEGGNGRRNGIVIAALAGFVAGVVVMGDGVQDAFR